jgi:hypothetical protein
VPAISYFFRGGHGALRLCPPYGSLPPTASNLAALLASFFADLRKRGVKKST